jgi:hypothetical protein
MPTGGTGGVDAASRGEHMAEKNRHATSIYPTPEDITKLLDLKAEDHISGHAQASGPNGHSGAGNPAEAPIGSTTATPTETMARELPHIGGSVQ